MCLNKSSIWHLTLTTCSLNEYLIKWVCVVREGESFRHWESFQRKRGEGGRYHCVHWNEFHFTISFRADPLCQLPPELSSVYLQSGLWFATRAAICKTGRRFWLLESAESLFFLSFFFNINLFIYLFWAVLGLCCYAWAFSDCGEQGLLFVAVCGLLIAVASLVAEHGL